MKLSDIIANTIMDMMNESDEAEIQRNELAHVIGCVPSQINYVLTSRFTPEQGYIIESRRGGGGYIRITRQKFHRSGAIIHTINAIGDTIDRRSADAIVENLAATGLIDKKSEALIKTAVSDRSLAEVPADIRPKTRSSIMKQMLLILK